MSHVAQQKHNQQNPGYLQTHTFNADRSKSNPSLEIGVVSSRVEVISTPGGSFARYQMGNDQRPGTFVINGDGFTSM